MLESFPSIENCEEALARFFGRKYCVLTGSGTSALQIAYSLTDPQRPKILLPAMVCLTPMLAVHYADRIPVFADVLERDATIDPQLVETILREDPQIGGVVAVHLFGHTADLATLREITLKHGVVLIEDLAQAMGGRYTDGAPFGSFGDCAIVSFGHTKILDVGGGGAFLTDDATWAEHARAMAERFGDPPSRRDEQAAIYRKLFYAIWESGQADSAYYALFDLFPQLFRSLHLYRRDARTASKILGSLDELESELSHRKHIASVYEHELRGLPHVKTFTSGVSTVPWRYTFRIKAEVRDIVINAIRRAGYDISAWYPSITEWTPSGRMQGRDHFPVANMLEEEVINLWVTRDYTEERALEVIKELKLSIEALSNATRKSQSDGVTTQRSSRTPSAGIIKDKETA